MPPAFFRSFFPPTAVLSKQQLKKQLKEAVDVVNKSCIKPHKVSSEQALVKILEGEISCLWDQFVFPKVVRKHEISLLVYYIAPLK